MRCAVYRGGHCRIPFRVALSSAQELGSKQTKIYLRGYLVKEDGGFALYADKESAQLGWRANAFLLISGNREEIQKSLATWNQHFVQVKGRIVLNASDTDEYWAELAADEPVFVTGVRGEKLKR